MSKVLKANAYTLDTDNRILIEIAAMEYDGGDAEEPEEQSPEEYAENIVGHAKREAANIIERAKREADEAYKAALDSAHEEAARIKKEAEEAGYREGREAADEEGRKIIAEAEAVLADAHREHDEMIAAAEPETVRLIIDITEKLINDAARINPGVILNLIKQGISGATITGDISVRVSRDDYDNVVENKETLKALTDGTVRIEIIKDLSLKPSDCVIETAYGNIDCSLDQQFNTLSDNLIYILNSNSDND